MSDTRFPARSDRAADASRTSTGSERSGHPALATPHVDFGPALAEAARTPARGEPFASQRTDVVRRETVPSGTPQLSAQGITKSYYKGQYEIPVLRGVDLDVYAGEFLSIVGQSGSGKSTLLHVLGTLDAPDAGELMLSEVRIDNLPAKRRDMLRNRYFGMIFQFYHLLPELTTLENVLSPLMIGQGMFRYLANRRLNLAAAKQLLDMVGLSHRLKHRPSELSGGEMQRTAIARALINHPEVLLADEPTGNLDFETGEEILEILRTLNRQHGLTIVMVTHDNSIAERADRTVRLAAGLVERVR